MWYLVIVDEVFVEMNMVVDEIGQYDVIVEVDCLCVWCGCVIGVDCGEVVVMDDEIDGLVVGVDGVDEELFGYGLECGVVVMWFGVDRGGNCDWCGVIVGREFGYDIG